MMIRLTETVKKDDFYTTLCLPLHIEKYTFKYYMTKTIYE